MIYMALRQIYRTCLIQRSQDSLPIHTLFLSFPISNHLKKKTKNGLFILPAYFLIEADIHLYIFSSFSYMLTCSIHFLPCFLPHGNVH